MKKFFFDCGSKDLTASIGLFVLRVSIGLMMMLGHGIPKIRGYGQLKDMWATPDIPLLNLMSSEISLLSAIGAEVVASALLILGLATRPAAFVFAFTMVVAAFHVHGSDPWFMGPGVERSKELALLYLVPAVTLILAGGGLWSLDAAILKEKRRRW